MAFVWGFLRLVVGVVFGVACMVALAPTLAAIRGADQAILGFAGPAAILVVALICVFAPSMRRAFGRGFLLLAFCVLAWPLSALVLSGRGVHDAAVATGADPAALVGSGLAGVMVTGVASVAGLFLGGILLVIGLVLALGGRREVIVVGRR